MFLRSFAAPDTLLSDSADPRLHIFSLKALFLFLTVALLEAGPFRSKFCWLEAGLCVSTHLLLFTRTSKNIRLDSD